MRHATVWAVIEVATGVNIDSPDKAHGFPGDFRACDWGEQNFVNVDCDFQFSSVVAKRLREGHRTRLPDCPTCALFVEEAMTLRAEAEQAKYDAEREAEKRGAA